MNRMVMLPTTLIV